MNLELIKKYEKEFLHMLHGGKLKYFTGKEWLSYSSAEIWTGNKDLKIVIDDVYYTYRIALAEGKTVEVYVLHGVKALDEQPWRRFAIGCSTFDLPMECYRIKPEEPKLKIGDYVTVTGPAGTFIECISGINYDTYVLSGTNVCYKSQATKWEPTEGEICIFWDSVDTGAVISKFSHMEQEKYGTDLYTWNNCMPFTGTLPPHMKDNK